MIIPNYSKREHVIVVTFCQLVITQETFVLMKASWRRLSSSEDVFKTFWSRRICSPQPYVFKMSWSRPIYSSWLYVFKAFCQDVLQKVLQDIFKMYHQVKLFLLTRLWEAFNTFLRRSFQKTIIYRGICPGSTSSNKFMVSVQNLQEG